MRLPHAVLLLGLALPTVASALSPLSGDELVVHQITTQLNDFLAHVGEKATHDAFWAEDLVYMPSAGGVTSKAEIMKGFDPPPADAAKEAAAPEATQAAAEAPAPDTYTAEDILVRPYGDDTAALTFRLVRHGADGKRETYRNSGLFVRRDGRWQVVTWQATKEPVEVAK